MEQSENAEKVVARCRICYDEEGQNELITPCECSGSMRHVHFGCIGESYHEHTNIRTTKHTHTFQSNGSKPAQVFDVIFVRRI